MDLILSSWSSIIETAGDALPVGLFLFVFHTVVLRRPIPHMARIAVGFGFVVTGLGLFLLGLERGLFPLGRLMAEQLTSASLMPNGQATASWYDYYWVYLFAFAVGFGTTLAEPALLAVAIKANKASGGSIHVQGLRVVVALGVAVGVTLGCFRIVTGTPLHWYIICGYSVVVLQTVFSPRLLVPLAYDSGGVTTSTVTVPLVAALGLGLSEAVPGRNPILDGFGLIAFASLFPIISVLAYAQLTELRQRRVARHIRSDITKTTIPPLSEEE
jgi:hypothetical protein